MSALFSFKNLIAAAGVTLATDSQASADLAVSNLATTTIKQVWRSGANTCYVLADLGSAQSIGVVGLAQPRSGQAFGATDTIRLRLDAVTPGSGALLDTTAIASGMNASYGTWLYKLSAPVSARYVRLDFSTAASYVQFGVLWAGTAIVPDRSFSYGKSEEWKDGGTRTRGPKSGVVHRNSGARYRAFSMAFNAMTANDAANFEAGDILAGMTGQLLACLDTGNTATKTIFGTAAQTNPIAQSKFGIYAKTYSLEEDM